MHPVIFLDIDGVLHPLKTNNSSALDYHLNQELEIIDLNNSYLSLIKDFPLPVLAAYVPASAFPASTGKQ